MKGQKHKEGKNLQPSPSTPYRVLARKYRPETFADLIGQDVLVRVLTTAIEHGRLAQAFLFTGVRGVGKTTAARILARALNCEGPGDQEGPRQEPCGQCSHCRDITEGRHVDVMEMDAASRTGVDDIREIIEGAQYRPVSARCKVYIIDEVHMLSKNAFNALLKTLEEPPPHIVFIFATTEIRRVPVTVVSRCQRFDLRRVESEILASHLCDIAKKEGFALSVQAAAMLARAAEGSVRDGLSLLDTAISGDADTTIDAENIQDILGLTDRSILFDLLDHMMAGRPREVLDLYQSLLKNGSDPEVILGDLLESVHWLTRMRITPVMEERNDIPEEQIKRGKDMAPSLTIPVLSRAWQILLKGFQETRLSPSPAIAAEMALIRLTYAADMPDPATLMRRINDQTHCSEQPSSNRDHPAIDTQKTTNPETANRETESHPSSTSVPVEQSDPSQTPESHPPKTANQAHQEATSGKSKTQKTTRQQIETNPLVDAVLTLFPGSQIKTIAPE